VVAIELAGIMHKHARRLAKDKNRAAKIAAHAHLGEPMSDPEIVEMVARSVCLDIQRVASASDGVYVVAEGTYAGKRHERERRSVAAREAISNRDWKKTVAGTDCMVKRVREWVTAQDGVTWVQPPGEGEAQIMHMLQQRCVGVALLFSGDSDVSVYDCQSGIVVTNVEIQGNIGGRTRHGSSGVQIWGKQIHAATMWATAHVDDTTTMSLLDWTMADKLGV
jgi:hypothetical protein